MNPFQPVHTFSCPLDLFHFSRQWIEHVGIMGQGDGLEEDWDALDENVGGLRDDEDVLAEVEWSRLDENVGGLTSVDLSGLDEDVGAF